MIKHYSVILYVNTFQNEIIKHFHQPAPNLMLHHVLNFISLHGKFGWLEIPEDLYGLV